MSPLSLFSTAPTTLDIRVVLFHAVLKALAAQLVRFDGEEAGDDGDFALAADGLRHGFAGRLALHVQVSADEEQALVLGGGLAVEGRHRDAGINCLVDERRHARIAGDGGDGVVLLGHGRFDGRRRTRPRCAGRRGRSSQRSRCRLQLFAAFMRAFLDRDPERVVLQTQDGDLHRLAGLLVYRLDCAFIVRSASAVEGWSRG